MDAAANRSGTFEAGFTMSVREPTRRLRYAVACLISCISIAMSSQSQAQSPRAPAAVRFATGVLPLPAPSEFPVIAQSGDNYRVHGAVIGFVGGGVLTWIALNSGGSTAPCNRSENQDALRPIECAGLVALGGVIGAGIGALIGGAIGRGDSGSSPIERLRMQVGIPHERQGWDLAFRWPVGR